LPIHPKSFSLYFTPSDVGCQRGSFTIVRMKTKNMTAQLRLTLAYHLPSPLSPIGNRHRLSQRPPQHKHPRFKGFQRFSKELKDNFKRTTIMNTARLGTMTIKHL